MKMNNALIPTESEEQQALFYWAACRTGIFPELRLMYHIPNGGKRSMSEGRKFKAEGVKPGIQDICLPVPRGGCHGLYLELKRLKGSKTSDDQLWWNEQLTLQGYFAVICKGWVAAAEMILYYLKLEG